MNKSYIDNDFVIETRNLTFYYVKNTKQKKIAISNISVRIRKGEVIAVIGHTGSGKSTFLAHLNGLLRPDFGKVFINSKDIWKDKKNINKVRFKVGLAFQHPEHQLFEDTIAKDIAFGPSNMGLAKNEIIKRVEVAAEFVGLSKNILKKSPFEISGGQKRKAVVAGVIAMDPDVLLFDELTAGLDPASRKEIFSCIIKYHNIRRNTIIFTSHNMSEVARFADRIMVFDRGRVVMFDEPKEIFKRISELLNLSLEIPEVTRIIIKLRKLGHNKLDPSVLTVSEAASNIANMC
ncbi:MAG: energy-coupling factor transporter ATPase [Oscillospiraceae bacterium]|jgi:energy-coupling factor transport system ATP-binding protein|nr:energy-coupling factor transporter ATPase [Oscillospiraceae bacterium]